MASKGPHSTKISPPFVHYMMHTQRHDADLQTTPARSIQSHERQEE
jgi:hypothetical protein